MILLQDLGEMHDTESLEVCENLPTQNITITRPTLAYIESANDDREPATGLDGILYGERASWNKILSATKHVTIEDLIDRVLPNIYDEYCPEDKVDPKLAAITEREIEKLTKLDKKLPPLATLYPPAQNTFTKSFSLGA